MNRFVPPHIEKLVPYVPGKPVEELERELGIKNAIKLASNENPMGPSPLALQAIAKHLPESHRYPDAATYKLREKLSHHHDVAMDEIIVGNGSNEIIDNLCRTFVGPTDHAVIGVPSFVCYRLGLIAANVPFTEVALRELVAWDIDAMLAAVRPETKLMFVAHPNNPTGAHVPGDALKKLVKELPEQVLLVMDEAYVEFADAPDFISALTLRAQRERLLVLRTFSKAYGLAAIRVGYGIGPKNAIDYLNRVRAPFNCNSLAQVAAIAALDDRAHVENYVAMNRAERKRVETALAGMGLDVAPSQANFALVNFKRPGKDVYDRMLRQGVIIRPMPPPIDSWLRITFGLPAENDRLIAAVQTILGE